MPPKETSNRLPLASSVAAVLGVAVVSAVFAAGQEGSGGVTGKIVELMPMRATLETGKRGGLFYINTAFDTREKHLKVGQYVTFHYYLTGRTLIADSVEQAGETGKNSKKHEKAAANASASAER